VELDCNLLVQAVPPFLLAALGQRGSVGCSWWDLRVVDGMNDQLSAPKSIEPGWQIDADGGVIESV
jgi:hypothetical protein